MNVINRLKNRYLFVLEELWHVCSKAEETLKAEAVTATFEKKSILKSYIFPMAEMLMIVGFITAIYSEGEWQLANSVVKALFVGIVFVSTYGGAFFAVKILNHYLFRIEIEDRNVELMVGLLMSVVFVVKLLVLILPQMFFITFLYIYTFYLCWLILNGVVQIEEKKRIKYMVIISMVVVGMSMIMRKLMLLMVPNLLN